MDDPLIFNFLIQFDNPIITIIRRILWIKPARNLKVIPLKINITIFHYTLQKRSSFLLSGDLFFAFNEKLCAEHGKKFRNFHFQCCLNTTAFKAKSYFFSLVEQIDIYEQTNYSEFFCAPERETTFYWIKTDSSIHLKLSNFKSAEISRCIHRYNIGLILTIPIVVDTYMYFSNA